MFDTKSVFPDLGSGISPGTDDNSVLVRREPNAISQAHPKSPSTARPPSRHIKLVERRRRRANRA